MKYAVIRCTDGNYDIHSEHPNIEAAKIAFHSYCAALWNDKNTKRAMVKIVDENLDNAEGYRDFIHHETEQTNEPE
jgi:hypothetical protein